LPAALTDAVGLYEGAKVNVNHPKGNPAAARDYQDRLGSIRNVSVRHGDGLFGDFQFNPKHALAEQLLWDAAHAPENVGFSHNVEARTSRQGGQTVVEAILKVQSVDLVADPATTRGLYENAGGASAAAQPELLVEALAQASAEQLRAARPDLVEAIQAEVRGQLAAVQGELDRLRACEAAQQRRAAAVQLLKEFKLPDPDQADTLTKPIVSDLFLETLLAAPNEQAMRTLVQERASAIASARKLDRGSSTWARPSSREQGRSDLAGGALDVQGFVRAISSP
ncbi:MAG: hypothetical protein HY288_07030, partial [Planctomycetia bacterium]|nr:hypothetical protein [Planctomycetia bacterium]